MRSCPGSTGSRTTSFPTSGDTDRVAGLVERLRGIAGVDASPPDFIVVTNEEHSDVLVAAAQLRPIDQEILRLTLWEELSHNDVALILGIEVGAVKQRAYRARRNLAQEYRRLTGDGQPPAARKGGGS
jgi:DNA-directed RNA polymerase specialized sigma24 family protein